MFIFQTLFLHLQIAICPIVPLSQLSQIDPLATRATQESMPKKKDNRDRAALPLR